MSPKHVFLVFLYHIACYSLTQMIFSINHVNLGQLGRMRRRYMPTKHWCAVTAECCVDHKAITINQQVIVSQLCQAVKKLYEIFQVENYVSIRFSYHNTVRFPLTIYVLFCHREYKDVSEIYILSPHCYDTGSCNPSSRKTRTLPILYIQYDGYWCPGDARS